MKRGYTVEQYLEMHDRIREVMPDCAVSSDFIVGHPGETEAEFEKSIDLVRRCRFKNSFIFKYSPRPGTKAFERYPDDIPEDVKRRRNNELLAIQNEISEEDNATFIGREVEVLVEGPSKAARKLQSDAESRRTADRTDPTRRPLDLRPHRRLRRQSPPGRQPRPDRHPRLHGHHAHRHHRHARVPARLEFAVADPGLRRNQPAASGVISTSSM